MQERALPRPALVQAVLPQTGLAREVFVILGFSALVAVSAQIAIPLPFTPVPITGQTFAVLLAGAALGSVRGSLSLLSYVGVGALGVPVYTWAGGPASWGYLPGFVLAAFVVGWLAERGWDRSFWSAVLAMLAGNVVLYIPGLIWLSRFVGAEQALPLGLLPFIPGDVIKLLLAAAVLPSAWVLVRRREESPPQPVDS
ncbi:MAG TPA: biotin transporter BioY [Dehalococcoidia bacterium]|nr:biotin transporter BioY [Dehalococcoidia bacterium]